MDPANWDPGCLSQMCWQIWKTSISNRVPTMRWAACQDAKSVLSHEILAALQGRNYCFHFREAKVIGAEIPFLDSCSQQTKDPQLKLRAF